jgi:hypothetical protein
MKEVNKLPVPRFYFHAFKEISGEDFGIPWLQRKRSPLPLGKARNLQKQKTRPKKKTRK